VKGWEGKGGRVQGKGCKGEGVRVRVKGWEGKGERVGGKGCKGEGDSVGE
jgi:hypothetical protein